MIRAASDEALAWTVTALLSTLAGNLTLLGSVANIIVIERALAQVEKDGGDLAPARVGFVDYLRVGSLVTAASVAVAVLVLWLSWR
jgi:Na+/H+ antiporter NhaD/arsenite permease-like protein